MPGGVSAKHVPVKTGMGAGFGHKNSAKTKNFMQAFVARPAYVRIVVLSWGHFIPNIPRLHRSGAGRALSLANQVVRFM
jgi:hypothetical protein